MIRFPLVLFDLDGTLVDSFGDIMDGIRAACAAIGVRAHDELLHLVTRGVPLETFYEVATGAPDATAPPERAAFARFAEAYRAHYLANHARATRPFPGVLETLRALWALEPRPRLAVATAKRTESATRVLASSGLSELIDVVAGCDDGLAHKPDPAVLRRAAELAGVDVRRALMVGDTDRDVGAARAAGCMIAAVTWGGFKPHELHALSCDWVIDRMDELLAIVRS